MRATEYMRPSMLDRIPSAGHAVIEASAGTGKTYAIEHLIIDLLCNSAKSIEEILVVTFTEKATAELRGRIRGSIERIVRASASTAGPPRAGSAPAGIDEAARQRLELALGSFERAPIFTIHAFCRRVLTEFAFHSGARFELDLDDGRRSFRAAFRAELRENFAVDRLLREALNQWLDESSADGLEELLYQAHRMRYQTMERAQAFAQAARTLAADETIGPRQLTDLYLPAIEERLDRDKLQHGQIDYDDLLAWVCRALEGPGGAALAAALRERYRFGLVDEFQDTDELQWRIFSQLFVEGRDGNRLFVVGDSKQAIYGFRNADVHSYLRAREELKAADTAIVSIDTNYRSTATLIEACNLIFDQQARAPLFNGAIAYDHPVTCGEPERRARNSQGQEIVPITLMRFAPEPGEKGSAVETREQLGRFIAETAKRLIESGDDAITIEEPQREGVAGGPRKVAARDIFVLTATNKDCHKMGRFLRAAGVPFAFYKLSGLFQTGEAQDVLDVLRALEDLNDRSRQRRAWMSPFFGLEYPEIAALGDPPPAHRLNQLLYEWQTLAVEGDFAALFDRLLHESGLTARELFLKRSERELTNYGHIFELLLERAVAERLSLSELIELLADYIAERTEPAGPDGNIQRLESERTAVQVMTVHMSKGLEADVVMLFGGLNRGTQSPPVSVYHVGHARRFAIGKSEQQAVKAAIAREQEEEDQRLIYVALTRARAKLYLPFYPAGSLKTKGNGYYVQLNRRLQDVVATSSGGAENAPREALIEIANARISSQPPAPPKPTMSIDQWMPPGKLLEDHAPPEILFERLGKERAGLKMGSYTSLKRDAAWGMTPEDFKADLAPSMETDDLPGSSAAGLFLHEAIERLDFGTLATARTLAEWRRIDAVERLFRDAMRRHQVGDARWFERGTEIVYRTLTSPITIAGGHTIEALSRCRNTREMEFLFPIPEASHPRLGTDADRGWVAERGYLKGYIDFIFEDKRLIYFADWKSDLLRDYSAETIGAHVERNYRLQALIYSVGVMRLLRISSEAQYRARFGGLLYVFLRGVGAEANRADGIYFQRPDWSEVCRHESELMKLGERA